MLLEISPGGYNKLNICNSRRDTLNNTQSLLRDPHIESPKGGKLGDQGRGKCRDQGRELRDAVWSSLWSWEREESRL